MKCIKCLTKNINQANYCKKCGYEFSDEERKVAEKWTLVWVLKKCEKGISVVTGNFKFLSFITDTRAFKILSLAIVLGIGILLYVQNGTNVRIEESREYNVQYNKGAEEYYIFVKEKEVPLNFYMPNDVDKISLKQYDKNDEVVEEEEFSRNDDIVIEATSDDYYVLSVTQGEKETNFKMLVYLDGSVSR